MKKIDIEIHQSIFSLQVGPIPIDDGIGKEIVTHLTTTVNSNKTFYTDSNGRDFLERVRFHTYLYTFYNLLS